MDGGVVDWTKIPGVQPFDVELLKQLSNEQLLDAAAYFIGALYWDHWWLANPLVCRGSSDFRAVDTSACELGDVETLVGERLLGGLLGDMTPEDREYVNCTAGGTLVEEYHADFLRERREEVNLWRAGAWDILKERGQIEDEDYISVTATWPDANPEHRDYRQKWERRQAEPPAPERVDPGEPSDAEVLRGQTATELLAAIAQAPDGVPERLTELGAVLGEKLLDGAFPNLRGHRRQTIAWRVGRAAAPVYRAVKSWPTASPN